jgi:hypothetical protein
LEVIFIEKWKQSNQEIASKLGGGKKNEELDLFFKDKIKQEII